MSGDQHDVIDVNASANQFGPLTAFNLFSKHSEIEGRKLKLSRMSFVKDGLRISGSVLPRIAPSVLFITLYSTFIAVADNVWDKKWRTSNSIIGPLSVVVGLLLVFRNGTSYERWNEGRKIWQDSTSTVRSLAQMVWINVDTNAVKQGVNAESSSGSVASSSPHWRLHRKRRALRLLVAYMYACKHHLRREPGVEWPDYDGLLPIEFKHKYFLRSAKTAVSQSLPAKDADHNRLCGYTERDVEAQARRLAAEHQPLLRSPSGPADNDAGQDLKLPYLILAEMATYLTGARRAGLLDDAGPAGFSMLNNLVNTLSLQLGSMERISDTTIPVMYGIHLKQCCLLYLVALPLALVSELSWRMIPVVTLVAITLMGLEGISSEIEDPFGDDPSDHPLDLFCSSLRFDIEQLIHEVQPSIRVE